MRSAANGNANLVEICKEAESAGIEIFAVAYDLADPVVTKLLNDCAKSNHYEPDNTGSEIHGVFSSITNKIENRLVHISR